MAVPLSKLLCSGTLELEIDDEDDIGDDDSIEYEVQLLNAVGVTGIHLHLQGNSSGGLFGTSRVLLSLVQTPAVSQDLTLVSLQVGRWFWYSPTLLQRQCRQPETGRFAKTARRVPVTLLQTPSALKWKHDLLHSVFQVILVW